VLAAGPLTDRPPDADLRRPVVRPVVSRMRTFPHPASCSPTSGRRARAAIGFVEEPGGSLVVAAGDADADWALNLDADPRAEVEVSHQRWPVVAESLEGAEHQRAVRELILRYGTPAERLGAGPAFRLRRADDPDRRSS
ncbi:MAG TPA: nitroreductase/quinone reductase family protein, partial [Vitreimonas sp.]|nr:nitroreductase/quinone reductase family protein [Vitreimonas sp.]